MTSTATAPADYPRPSAQEIAVRLGLKRSGNQFEGPCPFCGGKDRFHVQDHPGKPGVVDCRKCTTDRRWYADVLREAGLLEKLDTPRPRPVPVVKEQRLAPLPRPRPVSQHDPRTAAIAEQCIKRSTTVPDHIACTWRSGLLRAAPENALGWLPREVLSEATGSPSRGAAGGLVAPLGNPAVAVQVLLVDAQGYKVEGRDKWTYGPAAARGFPVGTGTTVWVTEGVADALAVAAITGDRAVAAVGTGGQKTVPLALVRCWNPSRIQRLVIVPDGDDENAIAMAQRTRREAHHRGFTHGLEVEVDVDTSWVPDPAAVWEKHHAGI